MTYRAEHTRKPPRKRPWKRGLKCDACAQRFRGVGTFDRHRVGPHSDEPGSRRCLTREEMKARGWVFSPRRGGWTHQPLQRQLDGWSEVSA